MCGIAGLHLRHDDLRPHLGRLLTGMLCQVLERGPDSAGVGIYGEPRLSPPGESTVSLLAPPGGDPAAVERVLAENRRSVSLGIVDLGQTLVLHAPVPAAVLHDAVRAALPEATVIGYGSELAVLKGVGRADRLAEEFGLAGMSGIRGVTHTRMATESAVTLAGCHPFSVGEDLCLVHNGSFSNHATIRRELRAEGIRFDSDNDSEVAARYVATRLEQGDDLEKALLKLGERFDGFYTLLLSTVDSFAVVRDAIGCKPAILAETADWVAMASEYRALARLPGIETARIFEPEPEVVYVWRR